MKPARWKLKSVQGGARVPTLPMELVCEANENINGGPRSEHGGW